MLWTKQIYLFDVNLWLDGDNPDWPPPDVARRRSATATGGTSTRCASCRCRTSGSTPGSPPGTSRSTASPLALVDPEFAKEQLWLLLFEQFQHPNGQIPAYEWEFSDLNPPVHAWAVWRVYNMDRIRTGQGRPRLPGEVLPQAADQLRLVGQQGRPRGQQRLRGRLPRPRQHHGRRPQRAAARRRGARAVRRHRLDGHVLPEPDAHRPGAGQGEPRLRGRWRPSSSSTTSTSARP